MRFNLKFLVALVSALCFNVSCKVGRDFKVSGQTFIHLKQGISMDFPEGWRVDKSGVLGSMVIFSEPGSGKRFVANINIFSEKTDFSLEEYIDLTRKNAGKFFGGYEFYSQNRLKIGGRDAGVLEYSFKQSGSGRVMQQSYSIKLGRRMYVVTCSALKDEFEKYRAIFERNAGTFKSI